MRFYKRCVVCSALLRVRSRWGHCWAFFTMTEVLVVKVRLSIRWMPRSFMFLTFSTAESLMVSDDNAWCPFWCQKLLGFANFQGDVMGHVLLKPLLHLQAVGDFLLSVMRPTTVMSSANLNIWLKLYLAVQLWVSRLNNRGSIRKPGVKLCSMW